jgi:transposase
MKQEALFAVVPADKSSLLSREELVEFFRLEQDYRVQLEKEVKRLRALNNELEQKSFLLGEQYITIKNKLFGKSSERAPAESSDAVVEEAKSSRKVRVLLPSERYPDAPLVERRVEFQNIPNCKCCGAQMSDAGMSESSEFLTTIPAQYLVIRQMRQKVRCTKCYGDLQTAPAPRRIKEGSSYSDEMMVDVAMTKYCDLIPVERYTAIAGREGLEGLPPHSLIESTHYLADFVEGAYAGLREEILSSKVIHADETPHRMLEGDKKSNWYLWGFSTPRTSYYECHGTRSGDVASDLLTSSKCEYLVSDVFSGYGKAVRETNDHRRNHELPEVLSVYCNAHARRKFNEALDNFNDEANFFIERYQEIYKLEGSAKEKPPDEITRIRVEMRRHFEAMREQAVDNLMNYSSKSSIARAMNYFLENYEGLTRFLKDSELPIDNNPQERLMRNPVIGRKTWYGTHSKRGAKTAAILFSLVESCKLNKVNPRDYFKKLVADIHSDKAPYTPRNFQNLQN